MNGQNVTSLAVEHRRHDDEELVVLGADRVDELVAVIRAGLPVDEHRCAAARLGVRLQPRRQQ